MNSRFGAVFCMGKTWRAGALKAVPAGAIKLAIRPPRWRSDCGLNGEDAGTSTIDFGDEFAAGGSREAGRSTT